MLSIITELDDQSLTSADGSLDIWTSYLSSSATTSSNTNGNLGLGWCVDERWFLGTPDILVPGQTLSSKIIAHRRDFVIAES